MANRSVSLYTTTKVGGRWTFRRAPKKPQNLSEGSFIIFWYEGGKKRSSNVGKQADAAKMAVVRKEAELRLRIVEGKPTTEPAPETPSGVTTINQAINRFIEECQDRCGNDGYGFAKRSLIVYRRSLGYLREFGGDKPLAAMDTQFFKDYRRWLRNHPNKFSDRTCHNIMLTANTMARSNDIIAGKKVLAEMSFPPKPCLPYTDDELQKFFAACTAEEELVFKFFLNSMGREQEVANTEVRDLDFGKNVLHISPKVDRGFRLKSKKGSAALGRKVPLPAVLMEKLKAHCKGKNLRDLVFPNRQGDVEGHFLRRAQAIGKLAAVQGIELHRFRKTGATMLHRERASVRQIQAWLGHSDLETTLIYLGVQDSADESCQAFVNNTSLAALYT